MARQLITVQHVDQDFQVGEETVSPLHDVNVSITENSFNIIYGPSGSGKSTLLNILTGLQRPTRGTVTLEDRNLYDLSADELAYVRASRIGFVYQTNYWVHSLSVIENVSMPLYFSGLGRVKAERVAYYALERVGMQHTAKKYPSVLSGGEQQRIAMARALVTDPLFIIADEPTGNLDSTNGDMIMGLLSSAQRDLKRTVVLVTHNLEYLPLADQLIHIEDGRTEQTQYESIADATNALLADMHQRIDRLTKEKQVTRKVVQRAIR